MDRETNIMVMPDSKRKRNRRRRPRVGGLTPNQLADRLIQLSRQWHILTRQEIAASGDKNPPSRVALKVYDEWAKGVFRDITVAVAQSDTLKMYDEYRATYGRHRARVAKVLGKEPAAKSLEQFDRYRGGFFGSMPWWGWLVAAGIGYLLVKELGSYSK